MDIDRGVFMSPMERVKHPKLYRPTIESDWVLIEGARVDSALAKLRSTAVPLAIANWAGGCDGTSFELSVGDSSCNARISWWCELPEEWRELAVIVTELEQLFERTWASRD